MPSDDTPARLRSAPRSSPALAALFGLVGGVALAAGVFFLHPFGIFDQSTDSRVGDHPHASQAANDPGQADASPTSEGAGHGSDLPGGSSGARGEPGERVPLFYRNPMNPTITSPGPAKDEMGMDYLPVYADDASVQETTVHIDPGMVQNMNVRTVTVERRDLRHPIRTVGYLDYDQERMVTVTTKYTGWVERVYVNYVGEPVAKGQPLFEIYAPELVQTEQELLSAIRFAEQMTGAPEDASRRARSLVEGARTRLGYWDVDPDQIRRLEATGEVFRTLTVAAPANGLVMKRMPGLEGMAVKPGMEIFHIADLSSLWLSIELFEDQVAWVREGTPATVTLSYFPGKPFHGLVRYLEPEVSDKTRTMRVKIEVPNRDGRLRKGMYATVAFQPVVIRDAIAVPTQAVLRTGQRSVVVVALGEGRFAPREVTLGYQAQGYAEVLDGLKAGAEVVTSSQFLLDSESNLREAIQKMIAGSGAEAASSDPDEEAKTHSETDPEPGQDPDLESKPKTEMPAGMGSTQIDHMPTGHSGF